MTSTLPDGTPSPQETTAGRPSILQAVNPLKIIQDYQDSLKEAAWASWVNTEFQKCKNARLPFERQWHLNLAFYSGKQYLSPINLPGQGFRLTSPKAPPWRVRMVINKIRTAARTECSKLTSSKPIPTVIPATTEDEDF